jgi:hypothetical protein
VEEHFEDAWFRHLQKLTPTKTKKFEEEEAKKQAEAATESDEKEDTYSSQAQGSSPTSPQSPTDAETRGESAACAGGDGSEASPTGREHPQPEPEHRRPEGTHADGGGPSWRSKVEVGDQKTPSTAKEELHDQNDNALVGDVEDVGDAQARGEGIVPPSDPVSHLRGARSRRRAEEVK